MGPHGEDRGEGTEEGRARLMRQAEDQVDMEVDVGGGRQPADRIMGQLRVDAPVDGGQGFAVRRLDADLELEPALRTCARKANISSLKRSGAISK